MPYATQQDLVDRFGETEVIQLSDRTGTAGAIDVAVVAAKLADADAEIDGYLAGRYSLPLVPVPLTLQRIACDIARYHLYDDRVTETVAARYAAAIKFLTAVSKGDIQLGVDAGGEAPPSAAGAPSYTACDPVFSRDTLKDFVG